jgi:hypothetical protein
MERGAAANLQLTMMGGPTTGERAQHTSDLVSLPTFGPRQQSAAAFTLDRASGGAATLTFLAQVDECLLRGTAPCDK